MDETRKDVVTYLETWAGHFGSCKDRAKGRRVLEFDERIHDVAEDVSSCIEVLPEIMEIAADEAWCFEKTSGFSVLTSLVVEAAQKIIRALDEEVRTLERYNATLQREIISTKAKMSGAASQLNSDNGLSDAGMEDLGGRTVVDALELVPTTPQAEVGAQE